MTIDQLVDRFAEIGVAQDDALWGSKYARFKRLFEQMNEVDLELRSRGAEARRALLRLYNHRNIQVRLKAAKRTLAVAPIEARRLIEDISRSGFYPQAGEAGMTLSNLDEGIFKPD
ncbi:MAG TPA: DUF2019 domain-containing protein [Methylovirgula sp.]|nr:DUF2019 domain-containing protein [Methylovirgula sp.]